MAKGTQEGTQGDPRGTQRKTEETKEDPRRPKRDPGSQMYQKCDTISKNKGDPRGPKGDPMTPKGEPRGSKGGKSGLASRRNCIPRKSVFLQKSNRAWRLDETYNNK